ncbi:MAG: lipopolysaccharide biosynthesis protein RfbH [Chthoniobacterales bacterium]
MPDPAELKREILRLTREYSEVVHGANLPGGSRDVPFAGGKDALPYAGRVFDADEVEAAVSATLDFWLTLGPEGDAFEKDLASFLGVKKSILVNSGSSANLLAFSALTSHKLGERRIRPGDEVITAAAGFPTTVAPIVQNGCVPVFIDVDPITLNARVEQLEEAYAPGKNKAVFMAHTLGAPFDLAAVTDFCTRHNLWLIEDNCDALGSTYDGKLTGTFGDLTSQSFYPPHHLTMGEGGAVNVVRDMLLKTLVESFRDWGRDCWCPSGHDNTCRKRFGWNLGELPEGYDHKYIYSHLGYNLKPLDPQAAIGRVQMRKLPSFIEARKANWQFLRAAFDDLGDYFDFQLPTHATGWSKGGFGWDKSGHSSDPSWFGFLLLVKPGAPFTRTELACHLDECRIGNRMLFGGNLVRQPAFVQLRKDNPASMRHVGDISGADRVMNNALFVGTYPGLTDGMLAFMADEIRSFVSKKARAFA